VRLNGKPVITADNSWLTYTADVRGVVRQGENRLEVEFRSVYDTCEFSDPAHANVTCPDRVYIRQAASSWGWDWAKRYSPQGVWRPIYLAIIARPSRSLPAAAVTRFGAIVRPVNGQPAAATRFLVDVRVTVYAAAAAQVNVSVLGAWTEGTPATSTLTRLPRGESVVHLTLEAADVDLWWPAGYGDQVLHNVTVAVGGSAMTRAIGFRTVRLQTDGGAASPGDSTGSGNTSMVLVVNGQRVLVRGSSLVPLDTFNGRTSAAATLRMLRSVRDANMNTLRVWGGGTYLPPLFYDLCDELGIMLMHDFMLTWCKVALVCEAASLRVAVVWFTV
jgi:beta-mannosidase